jgi:glucosamine--fructose-6-phosphate aminotransferase (isomerizing)
MCGIIAGCNKKNIISSLLHGLAAVEYRGYDSAGVTIIENSKLVTKKTLGKVSDLLTQTKNLDSNIAIAHTRWATHGKVCVENAHPHVSENLALVHNGIIENHVLIKQSLIEKGYVFKSETDTETIVHLLHSNLQKHTNFEQALSETVNSLLGSFAIIVINTNSPDTLYAICNNSPLILGKGADSYWLASDAQALSHITDQCYIVPNNKIVKINNNSFEIKDNLTKISIEKLKKIKSTTKKHVEKLEFEHFMLKEIHEQPETWKKLLQSNQAIPQRSENIHIVGCGSSFHAGLTAQNWLESMAKCSTRVFIASEYNQQTINVPKECTLILPSQSGETADTLLALKKARSLNYTQIITLCNVPHSTLAQHADICLNLHCGPEIGVASTKAFTSQLWLFYMLANHWGPNKKIDAEEIEQIAIDILAKKQFFSSLGKELSAYKNTIFLGSGLGYATALEAALKLKEISYIHAHAYPSGELKHGPLALIDSNLPVLASAMLGQNINKTVNHFEEINARSGKLIIFHQNQSEITSNFKKSTLVSLPKCCPTIAPMLFAIAYQLTAYYVAKNLNREIDQPRNLAKSVTVE